jgi:hypothetical protein
MGGLSFAVANDRPSLLPLLVLLFVILFVCHSRRESAVAFLFVILSERSESMDLRLSVLALRREQGASAP